MKKPIDHSKFDWKRQRKAKKVRTSQIHVPVAIIPCSGKGTRMGSPKDGKELLEDPVSGTPLIEYAVNAALRNGFKPLVILSSNKRKLKNYLSLRYSKQVNVVLHDPQPWEEWPDSVLSSSKHWSSKCNVLLLPDTRMEPLDEVLSTIKQQLLAAKVKLYFATHKVADGSKFALLKEPQDGILFTAEKPKGYVGKSAVAWGLVGFTKELGRRLFTNYSVRNLWSGFRQEEVGIIELQWFKDITRTGKVEGW